MMAIPIVVAVSSSIIFLLLLYKLVQRNANELAIHQPEPERDSEQTGWSEQWFESFSAFRYLPMRRLLSQEEEDFWIASANLGSGNQSRARAAFRDERRRMFREYLRLIRDDFSRLSGGVRQAVIRSQTDRTVEVETLLRLELGFRRLLLMAELRLAFHWLGVRPMDAAELIDALQSFEHSLREARLGMAQS
jgi:hypothetical protein